MSAGCEGFRAELERAALAGADALGRLANDAHARACPGCAAALGGERGLERLLAAAPEPSIPVGLAGRVLAGLAHERGSTLVPLGAEEPALEELLDRLPAPRAPGGLAQRVLVALAPARAARGAGAARRPWRMVSAAAVLLAFTLWAWTALGRAPREERALPANPELELDEELLAYAVERWDLLNDEDLDVWLASLDPLDELLLEYADGEPWTGAGTAAGEEGD